MSVVGGLYEFVFSAHASERERLLAFWSALGFLPESEGRLTASEAGRSTAMPPPYSRFDSATQVAVPTKPAW